MSLPQEATEVKIQPLFLQTRQAQSTPPLLTGHAFQPFHQLCCPLLDAFKDLHIVLKSWAPELLTVLKVRLHNIEYRRIITSFDQLVMPCLMHPRMEFALLAVWAHTCWPTLSCCPPTPPDPSQHSSSPYSPLPVYTFTWRYPVPGAESSIWTRWIASHESLPSTPIYPEPSARPLLPPGSQHHLPVGYYEQTCQQSIQLLHADHFIQTEYIPYRASPRGSPTTKVWTMYVWLLFWSLLDMYFYFANFSWNNLANSHGWWTM